ncbi:FKBP-type peptidyl-prolyl cis-trans isomerase [Limnoglobus roseus]|uniref:peptidylprolyl isomerase n=1 Tax=Limnoglobus roseus TaxID=2598579 RepID=A0A5C1APB1_9BACT|nr:FKBP-type peptidyl-prolyl cis-trans isomerase [Limnoglobus roseus]QEL20840.1 VCBS repeat-containing protein [Limnoglobus roseus]
MKPRFRPSLTALEQRDTPAALFATSDQSGVVTAYSSDTWSQVFQVTPFSDVTGPVQVTTADVNADGTADVIVTPGRGGAPTVKVYNGTDGSLLTSYTVGDPSDTSGASVASAGTDASGNALLVTGAVDSGVGTVRIIKASDGTVVDKFVPFAGFTGSLSVATADLDKDGTSDIVVGAAYGGAPRVTVFSGANRDTLFDTFAFESTFTGGITVSVGDLNGDGAADVVVSAGNLGGPRVQSYDSTTWQVLQNFFAFDSTERNGVQASVGATTVGGTNSLIAMDGNTGAMAAFDPTTVTTITAPTFTGLPGSVAVTTTGPVAIAAGDAGMTDTLPDLTAADWQTLDSGVQIRDVTTGTGTAVTAASTVEVYYTGWLKDGTVFDSDRSPKAAVSFQLTGLIQGWQDGLIGMKAGGIRQMIIPSSLGYGSSATGSIPANSDLVFEVKLVSVS